MEEIAIDKINRFDTFTYHERVIKDYFIKKYPKENIKFDFLNEEIVDEIIKLGIAEYKKKQALGGVLSERKWRGNRHKCRRHRRRYKNN